jgi:hypothetical protein
MNPILELILFILTVVICFYLPGKFLIAKLKLEINTLENIFFPVTFGFLFFTFVAYILAWFHCNILLLPIMLILSILAIRKKLQFKAKHLHVNKISIGIILICAFIFSLSMLITGIYGDSVTFRRDDLWHLALINELKAHFPPDNPAIAGIPLRGYHFFYDFLVAQVSNVSFISTTSLHFHLFPLFIALLWGFGVYALILRWTGKNSAGLWAVFLTMFGGNFVFLLYLSGLTQFSFEDGLGIVQPAFSLYNPPLSISVVIIIFALFCLHNYLTTYKNRWLMPLALSCGLAPMFKVYGGIVLLSGFSVLVLIEIIKKRFAPLVWFVVTGLIFIGTYWIFVWGAGYLIYFPFWNRESLLRSLTWFNWDEKITTYTRLHVIHGLVETTATALAIFLIGNLGTRIIGILLLPILYFKSHKRPGLFSSLMVTMLIVSIGFPLFFIQSGRVYEIVQMATYYLFFASLFASLGFALFFDLKFSKYLKYLFFVIIFTATIPSVVTTLRGYSDTLKKSESLSNDYFQAMKFLQLQGNYNDTVVELPPKDNNSDLKSLQSWYEFTDPRIAAFADKRTFYSNEYIDFPGVPKEQRVALLQKILKSNSTGILEHALKDNNIIYLYSTYELPALNNSRFIKKVFSNKTTVIYKVD